MSHSADQETEKTAIHAIYPEEFVDVAPNEYIFQLPVPGFDDAFVKLHIQYPPEYPDVPVNICSCETINLLQHTSNKLIQTINTRHTELVGEPYVLALTTLIEDALGIQDNNNDNDVELNNASVTMSTISYEEEFNPGLLPGPPLTVENFKEWWTTFCAKHNISLTDTDEQCNRPTGRQIWEEMSRSSTSTTIV